MDVIFDMETGDPDDLITLIMLLKNPDVDLKAVSCYQGSPLQIGLIKHVLKLAGKDIPVGGWNPEEPSELSPYYTDVVGKWSPVKAELTPVEIFKNFCTKDTHVLTGAPLTNLKAVLENLRDLEVSSMTTQGGYLGSLVKEVLPKFKGRKEIRTYNLGNDTDAWSVVDNCRRIHKLTYVTKDLCHGFLYTPEIHSKVQFGKTPLDQLLKKCFAKYASENKAKAMHDPLAMLYMLYPEIGESMQIEMEFKYNDKGHPVFSSVDGRGTRYGLIGYDKDVAWNKFIEICGATPTKKLKL
jgi:pyrimidine-specific ribonucleoside hydrolase